jgi:hypothetical protein
MRKRLALILLGCVLCVAATAQQPTLTVGTATAVTKIRTDITLRSVRSLRPDKALQLPGVGRGLMGQRRPNSLTRRAALAV